MARPAPGDSTEYEAVVKDVLATGAITIGDAEQPYQRLMIEIVSGDAEGRSVSVEVGAVFATNEAATYSAGDRVTVMRVAKDGGGEEFYITDFVRQPSLFWLATLFAVAVIVVGRWRGFTSLLGLVLSILVVVRLLVPYILAGHNPVVVTVAVGVFISVSTLFLTQGPSQKMLAACLGIGSGLLLTGLLSLVFVDLGHFTGLAIEEAVYLRAQAATIDLRGLLIAGIIIGALGVLDDVGIGQASTVIELKAANPALPWYRLYGSAMNVGRDHIAATVNTLILAYVGASIPLLLLFGINAEPLPTLINHEFVAVEILRMLVGSLGILATVPLTTLFASLIVEIGRPGRGRPVREELLEVVEFRR